MVAGVDGPDRASRGRRKSNNESRGRRRCESFTVKRETHARTQVSLGGEVPQREARLNGIKINTESRLARFEQISNPVFFKFCVCVYCERLRDLWEIQTRQAKYRRTNPLGIYIESLLKRDQRSLRRNSHSRDLRNICCCNNSNEIPVKCIYTHTNDCVTHT